MQAGLHMGGHYLLFLQGHPSMASSCGKHKGSTVRGSAAALPAVCARVFLMLGVSQRHCGFQGPSQHHSSYFKVSQALAKAKTKVKLQTCFQSLRKAHRDFLTGITTCFTPFPLDKPLFTLCLLIPGLGRVRRVRLTWEPRSRTSGLRDLGYTYRAAPGCGLSALIPVHSVLLTPRMCCEHLRSSVSKIHNLRK